MVFTDYSGQGGLTCTGNMWEGVTRRSSLIQGTVENIGAQSLSSSVPPVLKILIYVTMMLPPCCASDNFV